MIMSIQVNQHQERLPIQMAQQRMTQLVKKVQALLHVTQERCRDAEVVDLQTFFVPIEPLLHAIWQTAETVSEAHASLASELLDISRIYLAGEDQLQPEQLEPLMTVLDLLNHEQLTVAAVAEADRYLLTHGLDAFFPVHGDLAALY